jgi:hypothetical protein
MANLLHDYIKQFNVSAEQVEWLVLKFVVVFVSDNPRFDVDKWVETVKGGSDG